jgi:hypothetical protein
MGKMSRTKGAVGEREACWYLRTVGWPDAERAIRTGISARSRSVDDPGDVRPGGDLVLEVKHYAERLTRGQVIGFLVKLRRQCRSVTELGVLIERLPGVAKENAERWLTWWHLGDLIAATGGQPPWPADAPVRPVAVELGTAVELWKAGGRCPSEPLSGQHTGFAAARPPAIVSTRPPKSMPADPFAEFMGAVAVEDGGLLSTGGGAWPPGRDDATGHLSMPPVFPTGQRV